MDSHPNVLKFLFATRKYDNLNTEFWLATELQVGCLHTHLKENTVSWDQMCNIALTMVEGLTFFARRMSTQRFCKRAETLHCTQRFQIKKCPDQK